MKSKDKPNPLPVKTTEPAPWRWALALLAALALPASAARLAYEGFEYPDADGTALSALAAPGATGTGWTGNYGSSSTNTTTSVNLQAGLTYTGFTSADPSKAMRFLAGNTLYRPWSSTFATPDNVANGTYYYSYIFRPTAASRGGTLCAFGKPTDPQNGIGVRMDRGSDVGLPATTIRFEAWGDNGGGGNYVSFADGYNKNYFILGKVVVDTAGTSTNRVWIYQNPTALPATEPADAGSITMNYAADKIALFRTVMSGRCFSTAGGILDYDEFRIGNTFAEAFPSMGEPEFTLNPATGIENQTLTFAWINLPAASNPTLNGIAVTIDGSGNGGTTLPAPPSNTTYTLEWTGAGSPLTQSFTAIAPSFAIAPTSGYLGDTLTLNWQVPVGSTAVTLTPGAIDLTGLTSGVNGIGTTTIPAPTGTTEYTLSYDFGGVSNIQATFTLLDSFVSVDEYALIDVTPLSPTWRIPPEWDNNTDVNNNFVELQWGSPDDFLGDDYSRLDVSFETSGITGAGTLPDGLTLSAGQTEVRIAYYINDVVQFVSDTVILKPVIFTNLLAVGNTQPVQVNNDPLNNGVLAYSDRNHVWANVPSILQGGQFVKLGNSDKTTNPFSVTFTAATDATFFLFLDNRIGPNEGTDNGGAPSELGNGVMDWVLTSDFVDSGVDIGLDEGANGTVDQTYSVFFRQVKGPYTDPITNDPVAGETFTFFEQNNGGFRNMYGIAAVAPQVTPVAFAVNPSVINQGDNTLLQWTVPTGFTSVTLNPGNINVTGNTDSLTGTGNIIQSPAETIEYTLSYVLGANDPVSLAPVTVTVNPVGSPFSNWMSSNFPEITSPDNEAGANPDGDNLSNFGEFAFAGDPGDGSNNGLIRSGIEDVSSTDYLTYTFACRTGASFNGADPATASVDGVDYTVRASLDLAAFTLGLTEVSPAITTGLPAAPAGYEYRTFRVTDAQSANPKAFIQAVAAPAP